MTNKYDPQEIEKEILNFWLEQNIYEKAREQNRGHKRFYYLDGPPYTNGAIHVGHAWGKSLRDAILRYKRMQGFDVWDRPGFDMHGLPIEVAVEKKLGITDKKQILEKEGLSKFIQECKSFAIEKMKPMINDFKRIGVWMNWDDPYMTITNEYIEGAWWALKKADEKKLLYEGLKTMTWCPRCATALAKHELEYKSRTDTSIFVKLPIIKDGKETKEFLIIWTTTPWTLPFNLAVMVHPEFDYVKVKVRDEHWIIAKELVEDFFELIGKEYDLEEEFKGKDLDGVHYKPPFYDEVPQLKEIEKENKRAFSVIMSKEYVDLEAGSGLVHAAPGCGPEDYEVCSKYGLPAFNLVDEEGQFPKEMPAFHGLKAKQDDDKFIMLLRGKGLLVAEKPITHDYAHCWRCKSPVIFRATKQWFLAVGSLKEEMREANKQIKWVPEWAGSKWFDSWLSNLQDWCISRQRFWGIPLPIWKCDKCGEVKVIGSKEELEKLSGRKIDDLHRPWIDEVTIKCDKCGGEMHRVPDVLDVWLDSGAASWATLGFPKNKELFNDMWPADFILEGKDQIRGWFNSQMCLSFVSFGKAPYKAVYMHGLINDAQGRKMSKSLHNIISPYEVVDKYGADAMRFYMIGGANPGLDLNYNFDDLKEKYKVLNQLWNLHIYLKNAVETYGAKIMTSEEFDSMRKDFGVEEKYILSRMNSTIRDMTKEFDNYEIQATPELLGSLISDLSKKYVKMTRNKIKENPNLVINTLFKVLFESLKLAAPITPFVAERIYQNIKPLSDELDKESIHLYEWPAFDEVQINSDLEDAFKIYDAVLQAGLNLREKSGYGIRWPFKRATIITKDEDFKKKIKLLERLIKEQLNVKELEIEDKIETKKTAKLNFKVLGSKYKSDLPSIIAEVSLVKPEMLLKEIEEKGSYKVNVSGKEFEITKEDIIIKEELPDDEVLADINNADAKIMLDTKLTEDLIKEGLLRELARRIQEMRKNRELKPKDKIILEIWDNKDLEIIKQDMDKLKDKVGATEIKLAKEKTDLFIEQKIKSRKFYVKIENDAKSS